MVSVEAHVARRTSTILFLAANPVGRQAVDLGEECRTIEDKIRSATFRDQILLRSRWAARPDDLLDALSEDTPSILHFSGHGTGNDGLCFQADDGCAVSVSAEGLAHVMRAAGESVKVVFLNACFSEVQARVLVTLVPCVIGMPDAVGDKAAIAYAGAFYRALAFGRSVANAHDHGLAALLLRSADQQARDIHGSVPAPPPCNPTLLTREGTNADHVYIVDVAPASRSDGRAGSRIHIEIVIDADIRSFNADVLAQVMAEISRLSGDQSVHLVVVRPGSVRLTVSLHPEAAKALLQKQRDGRLPYIHGFSVLSVAETAVARNELEVLDAPLALVRERDFYRALAALGDKDNLEALLEAALDALVARVAPREAMIEVIEDGANKPRIAARGCGLVRIGEISLLASSSTFGKVIASGKSFVTLQPDLEAVLCVPIAKTSHLGVIYLQGKKGHHEPQPYDAETQSDVELLARALVAPIERLLGRSEPAPVPRARRRVIERDDPFAITHGKSPAMEDVVERLRLVAPLDVHVLLTGQSGVGKTLLANAIHRASRRRSGPFVEINCATLSDVHLESELFGAESGAHSIVTRRALKGKVEAAEGGTLFLDEVAELTPTAQSKLLQLLQSKTYYRLGSTESQRADVRLVAATNINLRTVIAERKFREDLYYRLQVLEIRVPSLAERAEDVAPLAIEFLEQAMERHQLTRKVLSPGAMLAIQTAEWPGNVRELSNRIETAAINAEIRGSGRIEAHDMFPDDPQSDASPTLQNATRRFQRNHILSVLTSTDWNIPEAAKIIDVTRSQIYSLIRMFEIKRE